MILHKAYCSICKRLHKSKKDIYYVLHRKCERAVDKAANAEAIKRGYKNQREWLAKPNSDETYYWGKDWMKQYRKTL